MNRRVIVAGLLGGVTLFLWSMVSHEALGLGQLGVSKLPNEAAVVDSIKANVKERGFYYFPLEKDPAKWEAFYANNPTGILAVSPPGTPPSFGRLLAVELAANVVGALLALLLLGGLAARTLDTAGQRAMTGATLGAFASISIDASYWNWYGFPTKYLVGQFLDQTVGWAIAMVVAGWWLARGESRFDSPPARPS